MKIGILREGKMPRDKRVPFTPEQCVEMQQTFGVEVFVQPSDWRCYTNEEYKNAGAVLQEDGSFIKVIK